MSEYRPTIRPSCPVRAAAEETGATLVETALLFDDGAGNLPADATTDGESDDSTN